MCEACLFCIYPLSAAVCTVLFPRTPEHSRRPPSNPEPEHRGPTSTFCKGDALSVLSPSLMITHVCWIWAGEKTRCRFGALEGQLLQQQMQQRFQPAQGAECGF